MAENKKSPEDEGAAEYGEPAWLKEYGHIRLKKHEVVQTPIEELDAKVLEAEEKLRAMGLEHEVWLKKPLDNDPSYNLCFSLLEDPKGLIMVQQVAGQTLRLLDAPRFLKQGAVRQFEQLLEFVPVAQEQAAAEVCDDNPQDGLVAEGALESDESPGEK